MHEKQKTSIFDLFADDLMEMIASEIENFFFREEEFLSDASVAIPVEVVCQVIILVTKLRLRNRQHQHQKWKILSTAMRSFMNPLVSLMIILMTACYPLL